MDRSFIVVSESFDEWRKDAEFMREYDTREEEFILANTFIGTRAQSNLTQKESAVRMGTSPSAIARLDTGRTMPSTKTLSKPAKATATKLMIVLDPENAALGYRI